nr:muscarinic acetylcholine receptor M2-like [Lytechinus pictus]
MSTESNLTSELPPTPSGYFSQKLIAVIIWCAICLVGVCGNTLVLLAISSSRRLQSHNNRFVGFLAVTDLLTCLIMPVQIAALMEARSKFFHIACCVAGVLGYVTLGASAFTLVLIAFNRYICLTQRLSVKRRLFSRFKSAAMASFGILFPLGITLGFVVTGNARTGLLSGLFCTIVYGPVLDMVAGTFLLVCVVVTLVFYLLIAKTVRSHSRKVVMNNQTLRESSPPSNLSRPNNSNELSIKQEKCNSTDCDSGKSGSRKQLPSAIQWKALRVQESSTSTPDKLFIPVKRVPTDRRPTCQIAQPIPTARSVSISSIQAISTIVQDQEGTETMRSNQRRVGQRPRMYEAPVPMIKLEKEVTKNMIVIVLAFVIAIAFISVSILFPHIPYIYDLFAYVVFNANSSINPIIYGWKHPLLKRTFRHILRWRLEEIDQPTRWVRKCIY